MQNADMDVHFYTLLYIDPGRRSSGQNGLAGEFEDDIDTFILCAKNLDSGIQKLYPGSRLEVLTNDRARILRTRPDVAAVEIPFHTEVPKDVRFYSAHFKFDAFDWISRQDIRYGMLLDADMVAINKLPASAAACIRRRIPLYYDITFGIHPVFTAEKVIDDKNALLATDNIGLWAGGEMLAGPPSFFEGLSMGVASLLPAYRSARHNLHHQGDEMVTSVVIESMLDRGMRIQDCGSLGVVARFWSVETAHVQNSIDAFLGHSFLHLPADKKYLASQPPTDGFIQDYRRYIELKNRPRKRSLIRRILSGAKHVAVKALSIATSENQRHRG